MALARHLNDPRIDDSARNSHRTIWMRLSAFAAGLPIAVLALGSATVIVITLLIVVVETWTWLATRPFMRRGPITPGLRMNYLVSTFFTSCAWLSLGASCWFTDHPSLRIAAVAVWCAHLIFVLSFMHTSRWTLLTTGLPVNVLAIGLAVFDRPGNSAADWYGTISIVLCFLYAMIGARIAFQNMNELRLATVELKQQKAAAEAANLSKSAFLAAMSHEIRTPLNGVLGMAQSLQAEHLTPSQEEQVSTIIDSGETLMALLNDVLDLSKIEAGKFEIVPTTTDLRHKLARVFKLFEPRALEKGLHFTFDVDRAVPQLVTCDAIRVRQCFSNLVSNAIKFTDAGKVAIRIKAEYPEPNLAKVIVSVADTGIGMSDEARSKLFGEFNQAETSTSRRFGGSGLGLAISRKIARMMQGDISAQSDPGRGSTFELSFLAQVVQPQARTLSQEPVELSEASKRMQGKRVLIVDDNPVNRKVATLFLKYLEFEVQEAENGAVALDLLHEEAFDLVLLDIHMPVMDGEQTVRHIRESGEPWADIAVIALTADVTQNDFGRLQAMGMDGYVAKPISQDALLTEIYRVLGDNEAYSQADNGAFDTSDLSDEDLLDDQLARRSVRQREEPDRDYALDFDGFDDDEEADEDEAFAGTANRAQKAG
jgi:signal transduction histidine kinase/DNA-binding NarL/FixJ family response regulator